MINLKKEISLGRKNKKILIYPLMNLTLKTNKLGDVNYDITKTNSEQAGTDSKGFTFDVQDYAINNSAVTYIDETSNIVLYLTELNHYGKGTFSETVSELDTETSARISLNIDSTNYLDNNTLKLDALIDLDLPNNTYSFKQNEAISRLFIPWQLQMQKEILQRQPRLNRDAQLQSIIHLRPTDKFDLKILNRSLSAKWRRRGSRGYW